MKSILDHPGTAVRDSRIGRIDLLVALCFASLIVCVGYCLIVEGVSGVYHDDGIYLATAKAMAQGEGYRLINLPDSPSQTKYPPLYPAMLAVIWKISPSFPDNLALMQWVSLLAGAATLGLAYLYLVRHGHFPRVVAAAAVLFCLTSTSFLFFSTSCLSEMPFALCLLMSMWALDRQIESPSVSRTSVLVLVGLLVLPMLCRTIGVISVLVVMPLALRHQKRLRWAALGASLIAFLFMIWMWVSTRGIQASAVNGYYTDYLGWWHSYGIPLLPRVITTNAVDVCFGLTPIGQIPWTGLSIWGAYGAVLIGLIGLISIMRQCFQMKVLPMSLAGYLAIVLVWPWQSERFLVPILPYLFAYSIATVFHHSRIFPLARKTAGIVILGIVLMVNASAVGRDIAMCRTNHYPGYMLHSGLLAWASFSEMFDWIKAHTDNDDVFASGMDSMLYLYTGRRAFRPFVARPGSMFYGDPAPALGPLNEIVANLTSHKAQYLVSTPMLGFSEDMPYAHFIVQAQQQNPGWLTPVYWGKDNRFVIWKVAPE